MIRNVNEFIIIYNKNLRNLNWINNSKNNFVLIVKNNKKCL